MTVDTARPAPSPTRHRRPALAAELGALGALVTATLLAAPAGADAPVVQQGESWGITCVHSLPDGGSVYVFGDGRTDGSAGGVGAFVEDADYGWVTEGWTDQFVFGETFEVTVPLDDGSVVRVAADLTAGEPVTTEIRERSGNGWTTGTMTQADLTVRATAASYDGLPLATEADDCSGEVTGYDVRSTDPAATIYRDRDFDSEICAVQGIADTEVLLSGIKPDLYVEVVADHGEAVEKAAGELRLDGLAGSLTTKLVDYFTGEPITSATIDVALRRAGRTWHSEEAFGTLVERTSRTPYLADVTVTLGDGRVGHATCSAVAATTQVRIRPSHGEE